MLCDQPSTPEKSFRQHTQRLVNLIPGVSQLAGNAHPAQHARSVTQVLGQPDIPAGCSRPAPEAAKAFGTLPSDCPSRLHVGGGWRRDGGSNI